MSVRSIRLGFDVIFDAIAAVVSMRRDFRVPPQPPID
jgi:hypothetical protein